MTKGVGALSLGELAGALERLTEKTRRQGLLSLADDVDSLGDDTLRRALTMVQHGTPPSVLLDTLREDLHGEVDAEAQDRVCFIALGVVALQQGYPTRVQRKLRAGFAAAST